MVINIFSGLDVTVLSVCACVVLIGGFMHVSVAFDQVKLNLELESACEFSNRNLN